MLNDFWNKRSLFQQVKGKRDLYLRFRSVIHYNGYTGWTDWFYIKEYIIIHPYVDPNLFFQRISLFFI